MLKNLIVYILVVITFFNIVGCKKKTDSDVKTNQDADVQYGFLGRDENVLWRFLGLYEGSLMELYPEDKILVCGTDYYSFREVATNALKIWLVASGRKDLKIITSSNCNYNASAKIEMLQDIAFCTKYPTLLGYHSQDGQVHKIVICELALMSGSVSGTILHEIGHAFGLCDQYGAGKPNHIVFHKNCKSDFKSVKAERSIMGGGYEGEPKELTEDDLLASKINACRDVVPANSIWIKKTKILDTWKNDVAFIEELKRLKSLELDIIPECLEILNSQNTIIQTDKTKPEENNGKKTEETVEDEMDDEGV